MTAPTRPLWECPRCRAKLVTRSLAHACGSYSVKKFLAGKGPKARALFRRFTEQIAACGPYEIAPAKTRVAFMVRTRFASVNRVNETGMSAHFGLPYLCVVDESIVLRTSPAGTCTTSGSMSPKSLTRKFRAGCESRMPRWGSRNGWRQERRHADRREDRRRPLSRDGEARHRVRSRVD